MKTKFLFLLGLVGLMALAFDATAGALNDLDADLVPAGVDVCETVQDGPNDACNQVDADADGYGNACDTDYDGNGDTTVADFAIFFPAFTGVAPDPRTDHDCDGDTTVADFGVFYADFSDPSTPTSPGPSTLPCAGTVPCVP